MKKYAKIDEKLLKKLDFEAKKPGFEALKKDTRVLASVEGTVADHRGVLSTALGEQFFHGVDNASQKKKLNTRKGTTLDALISPRVVAAEVERDGLKKTAEYRRRVEAARESQVFGAFVQKVIAARREARRGGGHEVLRRPPGRLHLRRLLQAREHRLLEPEGRRGGAWRSSAAAPTSSG